jgi:hypothetical protein
MRNLITLLITLLFCYSSQAEYCEMVHDNTYDVDIGYMYLPISQIEATENVHNRERGNETLITDNSQRLFKEFGLPDVNSVVELNASSFPFY